MSKDDFHIIMYKILAYYYSSIKQGVIPSRDKAMELAGCNEVYFDVVFASLVDDGYLAGNVVRYFGTTEYKQMRITSSGVTYLETNSKMAEVKSFLGAAFEKVLTVAISATAAIS